MRQLVSGVHKFQKDAFAGRQQLFEKLVDGQHPHSLFITCADSRINPALLTQAEPGELFILRNAGNIVPTYGKENGAEAAGIEYALTALGVEHIVVCGHTHCGAITALVDPDSAKDMPAVASWLAHAATTKRVVDENYADRTLEERVNIAIQENVLSQLENLRTHPVVASGLAAKKLWLHAWIYKIETGDVFTYDPDEGQFTAVSEGLAPNPQPLHALVGRMP